MNSNKFSTVGVCSIAIVALLLPLLALFSGSPVGFVVMLFIVRVSPLIAIASGIAGFVTLLQARSKDALSFVLLPAAASVVFVLAALGVSNSFSNSDAIVYYLLTVHVMAPLASAIAATFGCFAKLRDESSAKRFASVALFSPFLMLVIYGFALLF
jgi:hypothetical protein